MTDMVNTVNQKILEVTEKIISYGIPVLYFLISVAFYLKTYDSAQIKITLIQMGGTVILAAWLIKIIEEDALPFLKQNLIFSAALILFLISGIVSYFHSPLPLASGNELIRRVIYIAIALIVLKEFNSHEKMSRLFSWLIAAAYVATVYGVVQFLDTRNFPSPPEPGLDPFIWRGAFGPRVFSTFGNPNFFGDFLVVMSPITLALYLRRRKFHLLVLWFLIAFNVYATESKGAWLGFGAGLVIFAFLWVGFLINANKQKVRLILLAMVVLTVSVVSVGIYKNLKGRPDSGSFRVYTWLSTWEMIKTEPWLGTGIGTFYVTYPAWRRPQIFFIEGKHNTETDHPENEYLEVWYDEGLIGFGIFVWLLLMVLLSGWRNLGVFSSLHFSRDGGDNRAWYQLGILTAISAQLVHNFVCVSLRFVSSGIFLWLLIGLIGALSIHHPLAVKTPPLLAGPKPWPQWLRRGLQGCVIAGACWFLYIFYGYFDADMNHNQAIFYSKQGQWTEALDRYETVARENPSFIMAHYFMGNVYNDRWQPGDMERSIGKYEDVWKLAPNYVQSHHQAGLIYLKAGEDQKRLEDDARQKGDKKAAAACEAKKKEYWTRALAEFERYRKIDPIFSLNYYRLAWIYIQMGQPDKAEAIYLAHLEYPEQLKKPPHNAWVENWQARRTEEYAETCVNLGNLKFLNNDFKSAETWYRKALEYNPNGVNAMKNLAVLYGRQGRMQDATALWYKLREIAPRDADVQRMFSQPPGAAPRQ